MLDSGADLIQIYMGLIYEGPGLPASILNALEAHITQGHQSAGVARGLQRLGQQTRLGGNMHAEGGGDQHWRHRAADLGGLLVLAGLIGLLFWFRSRNTPSSDPRPAGVSTSAISVYFCQPGIPRSSSTGPIEALDQALLEANLTIDMAVYGLDLEPVSDALIKVAGKGVRVRIVAESDESDRGQLPRIQASGIPVVLDRRPSLMHDKFTVIDGREVWTGSMNYTSNGVDRNNNNLVRLRSADAARLFTQEFDEMFLEDRFSALSLAAGEPNTVDVGGAPVEILFSPDDHPADRIVTEIEGASSRVDVLAFSHTSEDIAAALLDRMRAGVRVRGVLEADLAAGLGSQFEDLKGSGMDLRLDGNPGLLHHKVIVIDGAAVITGSYNFSRSAETTNDENVTITHSPEAAHAFEAEFDRLYDAGLP
jgi:phosphatidylserine/phosphatidylglycerophosphate/cardiolipin synthase-like enzyme